MVRPHETAWRPKIFEAYARRGSFRDLFIFRFGVARVVGDVRADSHMIGAEMFRDVIYMIKHRAQVTGAAEKRRDAADAHVAAAISDRSNDLIRLAADVVGGGCRRLV